MLRLLEKFVLFEEILVKLFLFVIMDFELIKGKRVIGNFIVFEVQSGLFVDVKLFIWVFVVFGRDRSESGVVVFVRERGCFC